MTAASELHHFRARYENRQALDVEAESWPAALNIALANQSEATGDLLALQWQWSSVVRPPAS